MGFDFTKLSVIFKFLIIGIVYIIIFVALRIIYKDIKNGGRKPLRRRSFGLEVINPGHSNSLKRGGVIPINGLLTVGRKEDNLIILDDPYVSGHHARVYTKNNDYIIEDLKSTNGTLLNGNRLDNKILLKAGDEIKIGSSVFKVIG